MASSFRFLSAKTSQKLMNLVFVTFVPIVTHYSPDSLEIDNYRFNLIVVVTSQLVPLPTEIDRAHHHDRTDHHVTETDEAVTESGS